ncbi:MAG: hypothetical protein J5999_02485 [Oscillospiraceae bacterium]|nr:hypothetical protein [Oscillospiraceae bacterium]
MNDKIKKGIGLFISALVIILVFFTVCGYAFAAFLKGEQVTKIDKALLDNGYISEAYGITLSEVDKITAWEKHTFGDAQGYIVLKIKTPDSERFLADNSKVSDDMVTENSMNIGRREVFAPYLFYSGKRAAIVTDLPESFSENSNAYKQYSERIFDAFCNAVQE